MTYAFPKINHHVRYISKMLQSKTKHAKSDKSPFNPTWTVPTV